MGDDRRPVTRPAGVHACAAVAAPPHRRLLEWYQTWLTPAGFNWGLWNATAVFDRTPPPGDAPLADRVAWVLALGSHSAALARPLDLRLPIQAAKGYSLTMPVRDPARAFEVSLTDDEHRLVFSRLGERLRIAGMAELGNVDLQLDPARCELLLRRTEALFPGAGDVSQARYWCGLRPSTPSNLPCIGRTPYPNLYLDTGHGTLGWTHACGSGRALADIVCGRRPEIDFPFRA